MIRCLWLIHPAIVCIALNLAAASGALAEPVETAGTVQKKPGQMLSHGAVRRLAVAWNDSASGSGMVRAMSVLPPWEFQTPPIETGPDSVSRFAEGRVYVLSRSAGTVTVSGIRTDGSRDPSPGRDDRRRRLPGRHSR